MRPCLVARPSFFAAAACPRLRRIVYASSILPCPSSSAFLHSIIGAPLISRSFFTMSDEIFIPASHPPRTLQDQLRSRLHLSAPRALGVATACRSAHPLHSILRRRAARPPCV